jgi:glucose/arabinose dehydrogenase
MARFSRRTRVFAGLILIVASCSDDKDDTGINPQPPAGTGGTSGDQTGGGGSGGAPSNGAGGSSNLDVPGDIPLEQGGSGGDDSANPGTGGTSSEQPPPASGVVPNCDAPEGTLPSLTLTPVVTDVENPMLLTVVPGDDSRLFVLERAGRVRIVKNGQLQADPFLDLSAVIATEGERGLLGFAFHPDYANNGLFYVHYSANAAANTPTGSGTAVIAEFKVSTDNPDVADPASERRLLTQADAESNHNGGMLEFGKNGLLYAAFGDGGGGGDMHGATGNGQNTSVLFGKILRLDVNARDAGEYGIPAGNMTGDNVRPEIWSYGWRNPWRFSFDRCGDGDLYVGDVGQNTLEEIDFEPAGSPSGLNYGWRLMEAVNCFNPATNCNPNNIPLVAPVTNYGRMVGQSITGGYVYRGSAIPALRGTYIYADYQSARFFTLRIENGAAVDEQEITDQLNPGSEIGGIASFGMDNSGEVYVLSHGEDTVYKITAAQ